MHAVTISHNFETAHRLPHLGGKCANLHGHSWWAEITVTAPDLRPDGTVVEFAQLKQTARKWIDARLDHGTMIGKDDPLRPVLEGHESKVLVFGIDWLPQQWPTVEAVAALLANRAGGWLDQLDADHAYVSRVEVAETSVNTATWTRL